MTGAGHTAGEFVRKERYIVIKRKHLGRHQEQGLRDYLDECGVEPIGCVVVEDDWPEYETVWKMIEARVTGRAVEAAEGDLLGLALDTLADAAEQLGAAGGYWESSDLLTRIQSILSQAQAREVRSS